MLVMTPADLKAARKRLGLTQTQLAKELGMGKYGDRTVRRWERGETPVRGPRAFAVKALLSAHEKQEEPR